MSNGPNSPGMTKDKSISDATQAQQPAEDPKDREICQMAEDHYDTITQGLLDQGSDYAVDLKIICHSIRNAGFGSKGNLMLKYEHIPSGNVQTNISFRDAQVDMADSLADYIRQKGVGRNQKHECWDWATNY